MQAMVEEAEEQDGPLKALALHLIQEAYDTPRFRTTEAKERGIVEFTNAAYADCYRIVSKNQ